MATLKEELLCLLFPHKCFLCGRVVSADDWLCRECSLPRTDPAGCCPQCAKSVKECICERLHPAFCAAVAPLWYTGGVHRGIYAFKYHGRRYYTEFLAELIAARVREMWPDRRFDLLCWMPMHPQKMRERIYCQGELLAKAVGQRLGIAAEGGFLMHAAADSPQMKQKSFAARLQNAQASFSLCDTAENREKMRGKRVLLVDDILTTGATAHVCASLLLELGASEIFVAAAASTEAETEKNGFA